MEQNHLTEIEEIVSLLKNEKLSDTASVLQNILDNTFSGTELIMATQFNLKQLPRNKVSPSTQKRIDNLLKNIEKLLNS